MKRAALTWLLGLLAFIGGGWWLSANTEWVEQESTRAARGEARDNPVYAFEQLLRKLGMKVEHFETLEQMPPERARLVLLSSDWDLMPERAEQLRQWVQRGGHLVLLQGAGWDDTRLESWVPIYAQDVKRAKASVAASSPAPAAPAVPGGGPRKMHSELVKQTVPPLADEEQTMAICEFFFSSRKLRAQTGRATSWAVSRKDGPQIVRVPVGQGSATVLNSANEVFYNALALRCDNPLLLAASVQAEPGATVWIYLNEKRQSLLPWLWHSGWIAIVAGLLALAAALWRGAVRFGPRLAAKPRLRRSITEQVRGLGAWLHREGPEALLSAQQRALDEAAARRLQGYGRLPNSDRVRAVAEATGLARDELATAMSARTPTRAQLPQRLQLLEAARRRLLKTQDERQQP